MPRTVPVLLAALIAAGPLYAQQPDAARAMGEMMAASMDSDGDGAITRAEVTAFEEQIFASVDADDDGALTAEEMMGWEFGMADLAAFRGRSQAYETAVAIVFDVLDADSDGSVTAPEHGGALAIFFDGADHDRDGALSRHEFFGGSIFPVAMRAALDAG